MLPLANTRVVPKLSTLALPETLAVPVILAPVPVTTNMLALPTADMLTFPLAAGILTLLLPFANAPKMLPPVMLPVVVIIPEPVFNVPATLTPVPVTTNMFALPTALMLTFPLAAGILTLLLPLLILVEKVGVANTPLPYNTVLVLPVKFTVAMLPMPTTLATATEYAYNALPTLPVTLAPTIERSPLPLPVNTPVFAVNATAVTVPFTPNDVSVPTLVIFGCAAVVSVPV